MFAFAAALGLTGFAISLAAKDTISDVIAGMTIMVDQPFRVGDRIQIQDENTWGDVTDIGLRTTRIRTRDNRLVIVPNSIIGKNQIINYTLPYKKPWTRPASKSPTTNSTSICSMVGTKYKPNSSSSHHQRTPFSVDC